MDETIFIEKAVLHILDTPVGMPVLSQREMELTHEAEEFIEKLFRKLLDDDHAKTAAFSDESKVRQVCGELGRGEKEFLSASIELAEFLFSIMAANPNILPADLLCCQGRVDETPWLGLFKLNYRSNYIHYVTYDEETCVNQLIKQKTVLPGESQRSEEAVLINLNDFAIRLVEKEVEMMDGMKSLYLSKVFLACQDQLSTMEKAKVLTKVAQKLSKKYLHEDFESMARLNKTIAENVESSSHRLDVENVAQEVFHRDPAIQREYIEEIKKAGIEEKEIELPERVAEKKFGKKKILTDTGIEVNFPSTYYNNKDMLEFTNNPDGTLSIVIKNVSKIFNK